jgi:hypothetical protein
MFNDDFNGRKIPFWIRFCLLFVKPIQSNDGSYWVRLKTFRGITYVVKDSGY